MPSQSPILLSPPRGGSPVLSFPFPSSFRKYRWLLLVINGWFQQRDLQGGIAQLLSEGSGRMFQSLQCLRSGLCGVVCPLGESGAAGRDLNRQASFDKSGEGRRDQ